MAYASGPFSEYSSLPAPPKSELSSSRKIDFVTKRYVTNDEGGFEPMDDIQQRVLLLISFAYVPQKFISPQADNSNRDAIRKALTILTQGPEPAIRLIAVNVGSNNAGVANITVKYQNLLTGKTETVLPIV